MNDPASRKKSIELDRQKVAAYLEMASVCRRRAEWLIEKGVPAEKWIEEGLQKTIEAEKSIHKILKLLPFVPNFYF